jgi:hypothetical protein
MTPPSPQKLRVTLIALAVGLMLLASVVPVGASLYTYPWDPNNVTRILPFTSIPGGTPAGNNIFLTAAPGEYEDASFILSNGPGITAGINLTAPALTGSNGTIPASAVDIKYVKVWEQAINLADEETYQDTQMWSPVPELLLNNDSLVISNLTNQTNWLWMHNATWAGYKRVCKATDFVAPFDYTFNDAPTLQPLTLRPQENRQVWVTVHVPSGQNQGTYTGTIPIMQGTNRIGNMTLTVTVLKFQLAPSPMINGFYYNGYLTTTPANDDQLDTYKSSTTYAADMADMARHGILSPTIIQDSTDPLYVTALQIRKQAGINNSLLFTTNDITVRASTSSINSQVTAFRNELAESAPYGVNKIAVYGIDEGTDAVLSAERADAKLLQSNGTITWGSYNNYAKNNVFSIASGFLNYVNLVGQPDALNPPLYNLTFAQQWHGAGGKILQYDNPQGGIENVSIYRQNYGFRLWNAGYDGVMDWTYQCAYSGFAWNDWDTIDSQNYRKEMMTYPTTTGPVDTIQFEGLREGIDDIRYAQTLINVDSGNSTIVRNIVSSGISSGLSPEKIRANLIARIENDMKV